MFSTSHFIKSVVLIAAISAAAHATNFNLNSLTPSGPVSGNTPTADYKFEYNQQGNPVESGDTCLIDHLTSSFSGLTATVEWAPAAGVDLDVIYLKAGNEYVFWDLSAIDWSAYTGFTVTNAWIRNPNGKTHPLLGISHLALDGDCRTTSVPDAGATAALLGLGLAGLVAIRRRK